MGVPGEGGNDDIGVCQTAEVKENKSHASKCMVKLQKMVYK